MEEAFGVECNITSIPTPIKQDQRGVENKKEKPERCGESEPNTNAI